jgi:hypothetical protein
MFIRSHSFVTARPTVFPANSRGGELNTQLATSISILRQHAATQSSSTRVSREGTRLKAVALRELQEDLEAIYRTARAIALNRPGFDEKFRLPKSKSAQRWLAAARAIAAEAEPSKQDFIRLGLPANFLEELQERIAEVDEIISRRGQATGESVAAGAAIDKAIEDGMKIVRELDAIVRNIFRDDPATLAEWASARHIERAPRRNQSSQQPEPNTPTTPTTKTTESEGQS